MGEIFRFKNLVFRIWSNDHEPPHIHVEGPNISAIFLIKTFEVIEISGLSAKDIRRIQEQLKIRKEKILAKWEEIHGKNQVF